MPVEGGNAVAASITELVDDPNNADRWDVKILTRDWHVDPGSHWVKPGETPNFVDTWPVHCEAETHGAAFHQALVVDADEIFSKGARSACYSGFEGRGDSSQAQLVEWLTAQGIEHVEIVGLATDHCVRATALDAVAAGFETTVLLDHCAGVQPETTEAALAAMTDAGVVVA